MSDNSNNFTKQFESLLNKSIEMNKTFINEGSRMFRQFSESGGKMNGTNLMNNETLSKAFTEYVNLNATHFSKLMDLGLNFIRSFGDSVGGNQASDKTDSAAPSFVLEKTIEAGETANFQFLLDNVKSELVRCELIHSGFSNDAFPPVISQFDIAFEPQHFQLKPGESIPVQIHVKIPVETKAGTYVARVQVKGFEPAYFSINLRVTKTNQPVKHAGKKTTVKRKR